MYAIIVPILPFALVDRIGIAKDDVQYWISVSLAVFAAAIFISSRTPYLFIRPFTFPFTAMGLTLGLANLAPAVVQLIWTGGPLERNSIEGVWTYPSNCNRFRTDGRGLTAVGSSESNHQIMDNSEMTSIRIYHVIIRTDIKGLYCMWYKSFWYAGKQPSAAC